MPGLGRRFTDLEQDPSFPRRYSIHRASGDVAEVLEHITVSETELAQRLAEVVARRGELVRAMPVRPTARDVAAWLAKRPGKATLVLVLAVLIIACGHDIAAPPPPTAEPNGPCTVTQVWVLDDGRVATLRAHYAVCPPDSILAALGWKREP